MNTRPLFVPVRRNAGYAMPLVLSSSPLSLYFLYHILVILVCLIFF